MKITLAFLILGICLAFTNVNANPRRSMSQSEAYSHSRMMSLVMKRLNDWKNCHRCSEVELYCMERAIVGDLCFMLRLFVNDLGCTLRDFVKQSHFQYIQVEYIYNAVETNNAESLVQLVRAKKSMNSFVQTVCGMMNGPLSESKVNMGNDLNNVNQIMGGGLDSALSIVGNVIEIPGHLISGVTDLAGGVVKGAADAVGGVTNLAGGIVKGAADAVGGVTHLAGGVVKGVTDVATGAVKGVTEAATGIVKGLTGGLLGGLGGLFGGKKG